MKELDDLPKGLKVTFTKGYAEPVYHCDCGRMQTFIIPEAVEQVGWRFISDKWNCPFCTGNTKNLEKVFKEG